MFMLLLQKCVLIIAKSPHSEIAQTLEGATAGEEHTVIFQHGREQTEKEGEITTLTPIRGQSEDSYNTALNNATI